MYGSCATQLDLPSSDLDLVVCGLDDIVVDHQSPVNAISMHSNVSASFHNDPTPQQQQQQMMQEDVGGAVMSPQQGEFGSGTSLHSSQMSSQHGQSLPPMSPEQHQRPQLASSFTGSIQEMEQQQCSTPEQQMAGSIQMGGSIAEGVDPNMILDESAEGSNMMGGVVEQYSPSGSAAAMENYSPDYHDSSQHQQQQMMDPYSPSVQSHYSLQDVNSMGMAEAYTPGSYQGAEDMGMVDTGYGSSHHSEYQQNVVPPGQEQYYYSPYNYMPALSPNAQRVLRLASELEMQPWAVQVKAIPTATVPVVKMLADPSRLPGLVGAGDNNWMIPPPPISPEQSSAPVPPAAGGGAPPSSHFFSQNPMTQWRGTDIKNGLQPVDITFEGPEHGGIGSTTYSLRVVEEASQETGLSPESTPVAQVASVLKELLAQRRLNEPFSGGLSSYGLLLLLLAVLKDRKIIQEEMKKIEKQRQQVSGNDNSREAKPLHQKQQRDTMAKTNRESNTASKSKSSSSWASIAKKSNDSTAITETLSTTTSTNESGTTVTAKTGGINYSQVVQKEGATQVKKQTNDVMNSSNASKPVLPQSSNVALDSHAVLSQVTPSSEDGNVGSSSIPQGSNDVFEVLCSGELTSGKLLMHFLLFYGQHFDSQSTLIDINGTHHLDYGQVDFDKLSPFIARPPGGTIDPVTGLFSVDPIVVYDPLEGANDHNVSKRCYCWNNVRWVFAQSYMTVSSVVESSGSFSKKKQSKHKTDTKNKSAGRDNSSSDKAKDAATEVLTPILELLLSF